MGKEKDREGLEKQKEQGSAESQKLMSAHLDGNKPSTATEQVRGGRAWEPRREGLEAISHSPGSFFIKDRHRSQIAIGDRGEAGARNVGVDFFCIERWWRMK